MLQYKGYKLYQGLIILTTTLSTIFGLPEETSTTVRPGRYVPELYGAHLGKYMPDNSGKYSHVPRPYDGGYGDRGIKYIHDSSGKLIRNPSYEAPADSNDDILGPKDHLRFMIDFNYDNTGWQIIKFDWLRDGDENYKYKFVNENQLWNNNDSNSDKQDSTVTNAADSGTEQSDVHIDGEYHEQQGYNYSYTKDKSKNENPKNLQNAIKEVLDYIEINILPTL